MDLKALDVCYNSIEIFKSLVSIYIFNFLTSNTVAPTATPKVVTLVSTIVFDQRFFLSLLNDLGVSIGSIRSPNRSIGPLFGPQNIV
jgi:hypothetical protein